VESMTSKGGYMLTLMGYVAWVAAYPSTPTLQKVMQNRGSWKTFQWIENCRA